MNVLWPIFCVKRIFKYGIYETVFRLFRLFNNIFEKGYFQNNGQKAILYLNMEMEISTWLKIIMASSHL